MQGRHVIKSTLQAYADVCWRRCDARMLTYAGAGVMQGRHVIKSTLQANLAQFLQNADWVQSDSVKTFDSAGDAC
jgi:hypothetical protein